MLHQEITPETVGIRPITADEYTARRMLGDTEYDFNFDPKLNGVKINPECIGGYIFALQGIYPSEIRAKIRDDIAKSSINPSISTFSDFQFA